MNMILDDDIGYSASSQTLPDFEVSEVETLLGSTDPPVFSASCYQVNTATPMFRTTLLLPKNLPVTSQLAVKEVRLSETQHQGLSFASAVSKLFAERHKLLSRLAQ